MTVTKKKLEEDLGIVTTALKEVREAFRDEQRLRATAETERNNASSRVNELERKMTTARVAIETLVAVRFPEIRLNDLNLHDRDRDSLPEMFVIYEHLLQLIEFRPDGIADGIGY